MIEILEEKIKQFEILIIPTIDHCDSFQRNINYIFKKDKLKDILGLIKEHHLYIGKEVFKALGSCRSFDVNYYDNQKEYFKYFNPVEPKPVLYTEELYNKFIIELIDFHIEYLTKEIFKQFNIYSSMIRTAKELIIVEAKKQLIEILKELKTKINE